MRQEVRRGRKFVEYIDDSLPVGTLVQEIGAHDVSYQDENGAWLPADENWLTDGADGYIVKADKLNHKTRLKGNGRRAWYPRRNVSTEYLTFGIPQYWTGSKWSNFGFSGWSVEGKTITLNTRQNVTILVHSRWSGIKIDWVLANASAPKRMRYPVALTGITESEGVMHGTDGAELGRLTPTTATDANGAELPCSGSYANGYVEFQADVTGAVYPVTIDPDFAGGTGDGYIAGINGSGDYAEARTTGGDDYSFAGNYLYIGQRLTNVDDYYVWRSFVLFDTSAIGESSTVTQVNLKLVCIANSSGTDFDVQIVKQNWSTGTNDQKFDGCLSGTADDAIWRNTSGMSTNTQYASGNLATAWINKTGTTYYSLRSNRDLNNTTPTGDEFIICAPADHTTESYRPVLTVTYTAAATGTLRRTNMNAQMQSLTGGFN